MAAKAFLPLLCFLFGHVLIAQTEYAVSQIHDTLAVSNTTNESFALYLPDSFNQNRPSSIVFIFDPAARGAAGIKPFISASEKYGHILVCSNNSKNAPYEINFAIANNLFTHIFSNFNIKDGAVYAAGFSGGSRLASAIASLTDQFAGVVGCGAGFSGIQEQMPSAQGYSYVGLCGDRDMNYKEMVENKGYLNLIRFNSTLITFDGDHSWPPQDQVLRAFDWLHLQSLKKKKPIDKDSIHMYYQADHTLLEDFRNTGQLLFEAEQHERMVKSYADVLTIDSLVNQYVALVKSKRLKKSLTELQDILEKERTWVFKLDTQFQKDLASPSEVNWSWWEKELAKLKKVQLKDDGEMQKMAYRIRFDLFVRAYSHQNEQLQQQNSDKVKFIKDFISLLRPSNS